MSIKDVIKSSVYESLGGGTNLTARSILLLLAIAALVGIYILWCTSCPPSRLFIPET